MPIVLTVLDRVRWRGQPVVGERPQALLAALVVGGGQAVPSDRLAEAVWGENGPGNAGKALQVLISRTRAQCGPDAVVRDGDGYRLGVPVDQVDALRLRDLTLRARRLLAAGDVLAARAVATEAMALTEARTAAQDGDDHPLAELRRGASAHRAELAGLLGRALSLSGEHTSALPRLGEAFDRDPSDEAVLVCLLRSEAAVRGAGAALDRYERYRAELRERLGVSPGSGLERVHQELLRLDEPVRAGLHYDTSALIGRTDDLRQLTALVNTARVVSIVGPGGLGKTRLAHVLGRSVELPVVHFVGLVGVTSPEDLIGEVGSALGVRDSVHGRRTLTPQQLADVRGRIAQHLSAAPSLLILDNCEHLVDAVADLVAFLVATTSDLRVVTTSRAPLAISAERVYPLGSLRETESGELFRQRAVAARPDVQLPDEAVTDIVTRLDGLPLAIELAAAKARMMSVEEISRRLENRFALLRGGVRNAPDRHQTLLAVIDWSWNLLTDPERRALRWLAVFQGGVTLAAAEEVLGEDAFGAVQALVDQSLLTVAETSAGVRYRMLETVREFGRMRLTQAGEEEQALLARREWAIRYAAGAAELLFGPDQFAGIDALGEEEANLADVLRHALAHADREVVVEVLRGLGGLWSLRGDHARVATLAGTVAEVVAGWQPPDELADKTRAAMVIVLQNAMIGTPGDRARPVRELLVRLGTDDRGDPRINAMATVLLAFDPDRPDAEPRLDVRLDEFVASPDPSVAIAALQWRSYLLENAGDPAAAIDAAERALALVRETAEGPWAVAMLHAHLAGLHMQLGHPAIARPHAQAALPVLERLGALDDQIQLRSVLGLCAVAAGRLDEADQHVHTVNRLLESDNVLGGLLALGTVAGEVALARGDVAAGLAAFRRASTRMRAFVFPGQRPTGVEPWLMFADASLLTALAYHGTGEEIAEGAEVFRGCLARTERVLGLVDPYLDYPVCGMALFALGVWGLLRSAMPPAEAVRLLVLAERFAYSRTIPTMSWEKIASCAEEREPGRIAELRAEYGVRRGPDLTGEARRLVGQAG
ncbi:MULTISPECIES: BTAD domain-containing putative transcriptional regulator [unclassified Pseudofrankia]|uniref:BTAD domain-containing putative transcriptional regulator n=1 Tax=unclassified Pseudofrankia TaxID=2994372 RepID=UPI0008DAF280|nr:MULTISPECIES: BTAD domain-containing putative transcriptional regulator [unclassified Pseudofrankia]MDT3438046.1 BTAD domain-containing putative transcriptional regulator [Pseudofrankia sp. BMG5.37]OHV56773.1 transcriptional regulator [Pseudofrankia sp. BMG5.36]